MSLWQGYGDAGGAGSGHDLQWACTVYLGGLFWDGPSGLLALLLLPMSLYACLVPENSPLPALAGFAPLALATCITLLPALLIALQCLGAESQANEAHYFDCMQRTGLSLAQGYAWSVARARVPLHLRLVYEGDLRHFPTRRRRFSAYSQDERREAWHAVNAMLRSYFGTCLAQGVAPVRAGERLATLLLHVIAGASVVLLIVICQVQPGVWDSIIHQDLPQVPASLHVAVLALVYSVLLISLRAEARVAAFIRALQAHMLALTAQAAQPAPDESAAPLDNGWG